MICDTCQREVQIGDYPFCPHGSTKAAIIRDEIPGGQVFENGFDEPRTFYSHSEHRAALDALGLRIKAKWSGPNDQHLKRWDAPCAQTLENARILLTRGRSTPEPEPERVPITVTDLRLDGHGH